MEENIYWGVMIIGLSVLLIWAVLSGITKQEIIDCTELQKQATLYQPWDGNTGFFISKYQKGECDDVGMFVNAQVAQ